MVKVPTLITQAATDQLLQQISHQLAEDAFDPSNVQLLTGLIESLGDARDMTRLRVAETLGQIGQPVCPALQTALLNHDNPVVRRAAAKTLALIADPHTIPTLLQALLHDDDTVVQGSSGAALAKIGGAAVPRLIDILESLEHSSRIKGHAALALVRIGVAAQPYLQQALSSEFDEVRMAVVGAIAKVAEETPDPAAVDLLLNALDDAVSMVRCEAAIALGQLRHQPAQPQLITLLGHDDWETRKAAALALMKLGNSDAVPALQARRSTESTAAVVNVLDLAIAQLERRADEDC